MTVTPDPEDERIVSDDEDADAVEDDLLDRADADEADLVEQHRTVPYEDEDEPRGDPE